mgnify:CR=1 FL=1
MVKEYIQGKLRSVRNTLEIKNKEWNRNQEQERFLKESIRKMQEEEDIDFEIFSPRTGEYSVRGKINEMYEKLDQLISLNGKLKVEIEQLETEEKKFNTMASEIEELEKLVKK